MDNKTSDKTGEKLVDKNLLAQIKFKNGLVPVVVQSADNDKVLMQAFMNEQALHETLKTGRMVFFSRSRNQIWSKGDTSGHYQEWTELKIDCDADSILALVRANGPACHEGSESCFVRSLVKGDISKN